MLESKKNILLLIHTIDSLTSKYSNKFKVMNLVHLLQILDHIPESQMKTIEEKLTKVTEVLEPLYDVIEDLEPATQELIMSYNREDVVMESLGL